MKKEIITILILLGLGIALSALKDDVKPDNKTVSEPLYLIKEHQEPVHLFFQPRAFKEEYYEITTSS
jgi:hypothetical protein